MAETIFSIRRLNGQNRINFIGTYDGWTPLTWDANTVVKVPFNFNGKPLIDVFGKTGRIFLEAHCLAEDKNLLDSYLHTYAIFNDPYGTYEVFVVKISYNTKEVRELESIGLELLVVEVR